MKVGLTLSNDLKISGSSYYILTSLINCKIIKEVYILRINSNTPESKFNYSISRIFSAIINKIILILEKFLNFIGAYDSIKSPLFNSKDLLDKCKKIINVNQVRKGYFSFTSSKNITKYNLDFVIRGNGLLIEHGDLLNVGHKFGLISLHHGDNNINRGGPTGYWEVYNKEKESGITLQKLNKKLDGGEVLKKVFLETKKFSHDNQKHLVAYSGHVLTSFLKEFYYNKLKYINDKKTFPLNFYTGIIYKNPNPTTQIIYFLKTLKVFWNLVFERIKNIFTRIFINNSNGWMIQVGSEKLILSKWFNSSKSDSKSWIADPFFLKIKNQNYLIFELFKNKYGNISYCKLSNDGKPDFTSIHELIDNGKHHSYPFTFTRDGKNYCIPESQNEGIFLYEIKMQNGLLVSKKVKKLIDGNYTEPTLIRKDNIDYLFLNPAGPSHPRSLLEIYYCNNIIIDDLTAHLKNPVLISSRFARSAGRIFFENDKFYRPSQNCVGGYGQNIDFSMISFSKTQFNYKYLNSITPQHKFKLIHHIDRIKIKDEYIYCLDSNFIYK